MLCVTGEERTSAALSRRLEEAAPPDLHEIRLDLLESQGDAFWPLLGIAHGIVACRGPEQGGEFRGSQAQRGDLLLRALEQRPGYLEVDLSLPSQVLNRLWERRGQTRIVLSIALDADGSPELELPRRLPEISADVVKVVTRANDCVHIARIGATLERERRPVVRAVTGAAGVASTALYRRLGSHWTYVSAADSGPTTSGRLTLQDARAMRIRDSERLAPVVLVGAECVLGSPGIRVYNRLFRERGLPYLYIPAPTARPLETVRTLEALGAAGFSITRPAKIEMSGCLDLLAPSAEEAGAVNTVVARNGKRLGYNTDIEAIQALLSVWSSASAMVLGAGGAARAAVAALRRLGCSVVVASRSQVDAERMAARSNVRAAHWEERGRIPCDVVVNATPCGDDGNSDPMPAEVCWKDKVVLDAVISAEPTPLLRRVAEGGGTPIAGLEWWVRQGAAQMSLITGEPFTAEDLKQAMGD